MRDVTLLFLLRDGEILLAMKKRGFGEGKWNGAGGKVEPGETIEQAAIRECQEEIGVTPRNLEQVADITFLMTHDPNFGHHGLIFVVTDWEGEPHETEEMRPQWFAIDSIPYDTMWSDDRLWLPLVLAGKHLAGTITLGPDGEVADSGITSL
jgi:8-oxo-dGTP diphosphatase